MKSLFEMLAEYIRNGRFAEIPVVVWFEAGSAAGAVIG
jgi:hypothetical protein